MASYGHDDGTSIGGIMERQIEQAVLRAIDTMRRNLGEEIAIDDLARAALFSKFHFSRVFHRVTGLSPGHFLSALRIQEAKRLLATTPMSVTDISHRVGYASVGSFTTRFTHSVGASPTLYRQYSRTSHVGPGIRRKDGCRRSHGGTVEGNVWSLTSGRPVFVGLFPDRVMQGLPIRSTFLHCPGPYVLEDIPPGAWHLMACLADEPGGRHADPPHIGRYGPIVMRMDTGNLLADIRLKVMGPLDPPILLAVGDLQPAPLTATGA